MYYKCMEVTKIPSSEHFHSSFSRAGGHNACDNKIPA